MQSVFTQMLLSSFSSQRSSRTGKIKMIMVVTTTNPKFRDRKLSTILPVRPQRTYKRYNRDNRTPLFHDPTLPPGWSRFKCARNPKSYWWVGHFRWSAWIWIFLTYSVGKWRRGWQEQQLGVGTPTLWTQLGRGFAQSKRSDVILRGSERFSWDGRTLTSTLLAPRDRYEEVYTNQKRILTYPHQVIEEDQNIPFWEEPGDLDPSQFLDDNFHCPQVIST